MLAFASFVAVSLPPMLSLTGPYRPRYRDGPPRLTQPLSTLSFLSLQHGPPRTTVSRDNVRGLPGQGLLTTVPGKRQGLLPLLFPTRVFTANGRTKHSGRSGKALP